MPKIAVVCGSMRFYNQMLALTNELTLEGKVVLLPFVLKVDDPGLDEELQALHRHKIDMADEVYILIDHKMGESTSEEYEYAKLQKKSILIYRDFLAVGKKRFSSGWESKSLY